MKRLFRMASIRGRSRAGQRTWSTEIEDLETINFLQDMKYLTRLRDKFPKVKIDVLAGKLTIQENGSLEQFDEVVKRCRRDLSEIEKISVPMTLGETNIWDIIVCKEARECIQNILIHEKIDAKVTPSEDRHKSVRIVAFSSVDLRRAREVIAETFVRNTVVVPDDIDPSTEAGELKEIEQFYLQLQRGKPIKIQIIVENSRRRLIELVGVSDMVDETKSAVEKFLQNKRIKTEHFPIVISNNAWDFLYYHFGTKVKPIEKQLDHLHVTINLTEQPKVLLLEGTTDGLRICKETLEKFIQTVVQKDETITSPDVQNLFASGEAGESQLRIIEKDQNVVIRKNQFVDLVSIPLPKDTTVSQSHVRRNGGVKISIKNGRIENEMADILVNSALPNLNINSPCLKVLKERGGQALIKECSKHTAIPRGDIVYTCGGNLACKYVIHAVCQKWNNDEPAKSEDFFKGLIKKILEKCIKLGASSVAMPIIGTGKYDYSEDLVLEIIREEVVKMFTEKGSEFSLNDVRVIIFEENDIKEAVAKSFEIDSPDKIILHFIGSQQDVDESFAKVEKFVDKHRDRKQEMEMRRNDSFMSINLPSFWEKQPREKVVHLVDLEESSFEFKEIINHFNVNWNDKKIVMKVSVKKIQRVQNPGLYSSYLTKKKSMEGRENEMRLFHGTATKNIPVINVQNFSRSYTGTTGGSKYGQGVYFAKESWYSSHFCKDEDDKIAELSSKDLQMYVVKVLVGEFTLGSEEMKAPPLRNDPANPGLQFDSVVNDICNPTTFVIFQDNQCYPEYLITFTVKR